MDTKDAVFCDLSRANVAPGNRNEEYQMPSYNTYVNDGLWFGDGSNHAVDQQHSHAECGAESERGEGNAQPAEPITTLFVDVKPVVRTNAGAPAKGRPKKGTNSTTPNHAECAAETERGEGNVQSAEPTTANLDVKQVVRKKAGASAKGRPKGGTNSKTPKNGQTTTIKKIKFKAIPRKKSNKDVLLDSRSSRSASQAAGSPTSQAPTSSNGASSSTSDNWNAAPHDLFHPDERLGHYVVNTPEFANPAILQDFVTNTNFGVAALIPLRNAAIKYKEDGDVNMYKASCESLTLAILANSLAQSVVKLQQSFDGLKSTLSSPDSVERAEAAIGFGAYEAARNAFVLKRDRFCAGTSINDCYVELAEQWKGRITSQAKTLEFLNCFVETLLTKCYIQANYVLLTYRIRKLKNGYIDVDGKAIVAFVVSTVRDAQRGKVTQKAEANISRLVKDIVSNFRRRARRAVLSSSSESDKDDSDKSDEDAGDEDASDDDMEE